MFSSGQSQTPDGWIGTETVQTPFGDLEFKQGYPTEDAAAKLRDPLLTSRAAEAYLAQMPGVSWYRPRQGPKRWKNIAPVSGS